MRQPRADHIIGRPTADRDRLLDEPVERVARLLHRLDAGGRQHHHQARARAAARCSRGSGSRRSAAGRAAPERRGSCSRNPPGGASARCGPGARCPVVPLIARGLRAWTARAKPPLARGNWRTCPATRRPEPAARCLRVQNKPLDRLHHFVLQVLQLQPAAGGPPLLPLGEALTGQLLRALAHEGLTERSGESWALTERGKQRRPLGHFPILCQERRIFSFVEHVDGSCHRLGLPKFIPLVRSSRGVAGAGAVPPGHRLGLRDCFSQPDTWKEQVGFPAGVMLF